jgi:hypothetical protein
MVEASNFTKFIFVLAEEMAVEVTDSVKYHLCIARGQVSLHNLLSTVSASDVDVATHHTTATLQTGMTGSPLSPCDPRRPPLHAHVIVY